MLFRGIQGKHSAIGDRPWFADFPVVQQRHLWIETPGFGDFGSRCHVPGSSEQERILGLGFHDRVSALAY